MKLLHSLKRRTPLGWLQLNKEKTRLLVALCGVAFADILMLMQLGFENALYESGVQTHRSLNADIILSGSGITTFTNSESFSRRRLYQALDVPGVATADPLYRSILRWKHPITLEKNSALLLGFDPDRELFTRPEINAQLHKIRLTDRILFDQQMRGSFDDIISQIQQDKTPISEINEHQVKLSGLISMGSSFTFDGVLIGSDQTFLRLRSTRPSSLIDFGLLTIEPGQDVNQIAESLRSHLSDDVRVFTREELIELEQNYLANETAIGFIFSLGTGMGFVVGIILVYQVLATDVNSHMEEYATFRAMGYGQQFLLGIVLEEAVILAVLGFIPSLGIAYGLYNLTRGATALPLVMTFTRAGGVLAATIVMCLVSGVVATRRLKEADPADIF